MTAKKGGIIVRFYQDFKSASHDLGDSHLHFENYGHTYTAEQLLVLACKQKKIGPSGFYIFGLCRFGRSGWWLTPNEKVECTHSELKEYMMRIRFIPSLSGLHILGKDSTEAFNYFFLQCRNDFVQDKVVLKKKIGQECILGLGVLDMFRMGRENGYDLADLKKEEPRNFIPGSSKKLFKSMWDKAKLKSNVNSELEKLFAANFSVKECKVRYIHGFINYSLQYGIEKFQTEDNETVVVDPHHEKYSGIYLQKERENKAVDICSIQDVMFINKSSFGGKWQVTISRKHGGTPKALHFTEESDAEAFISVVDGYHRLMDDFHYQVCSEVSSAMVENLGRIKCHGPVGKVWAIKRLATKHSTQPEFNFLMRQHGAEFDCHIIHYITSRPKSEITTIIICKNDQGFWHLKNKEEPKFLKVLDLLQHGLNKSDQKVVFRYVPPTSPMDVNIFLCRKNIREDDTEEKPDHEVKSQVNLISGISERLIQGTIGAGKFTELHKVLWDKESNHLQRVAVKRLKHQYSPQYLEELMEGMHRVTFWRCPTLVSVQAICLHPYLVVLEHAEHGNLEDYIGLKPIEEKDTVSIADQVAQALLYIHENVREESGQNCGYHGNVRCRNVFVFTPGTGSQYNSIKVKLGDPGMLALYNKLPLDNVINEERLPWIAPELYSTTVNLAANNQYSDIYSYGVFLWEIFSAGDRPFATLNIKEILRTVLYKGGLQPPVDCYKGVGALISWCLRNDIGNRPSAKEIVRDLGKIMQEYSGPANMYNMTTYGWSVYQGEERERKSVDLSESEQTAIINSLVEQSTNNRQHTEHSLRFDSFSSPPSSPSAQSPVITDQSPAFSFYDSRAPLLPRQLSSSNSRRDSETAASEASQMTVTTELDLNDTDAIQQRPLPLRPQLPLSDLKHIVHPERLYIESEVPLGKGHYGQVHRALYTLPSGIKQTVAVKSLNVAMYNRFHKEFDKECKMMAQLEHTNIVQIIGQCSEKDNHATLLVMEFVEKGSLRDFLREGITAAIKEGRKESFIERMVPKLHVYSLEMAQGMIFLSEKKIVHRDLAARNVLVTRDETMKISDFGLARNLSPDKNYYSMSDRKQEIPAYWCAPESLESRKFSTASDVWSYGITMWEVYTFSQQPKLCEVESLFYVLTIRKERLPQPGVCPADLYNDIMYACWDLEPEKRITFQDLARYLQNYQPGQFPSPQVRSTNPFTAQHPTKRPTPILSTENNESRAGPTSLIPVPTTSHGDSLVTSIDVSLNRPLVNSPDQSFSLPPPPYALNKDSHKIHPSRPLVNSIPKGIVNEALSQDRALPEVPSYSNHLLDPEVLIISKDRILGVGHYGQVHEGKYRDKKTAVKVLKPKMVEKYCEEFDKECKLMTKFKHDHIVQVIGQCMKSVLQSNGEPQEQMVLVMEYVDKGSLKSFLRKKKGEARDKCPQDSERWREMLRSQIPQLIVFMDEIAQGMAYLHSVNVVHRDLAARNVLVTRNDHMKISDFGLARTLGGDKDYYQMSNQSEGIPALWCAPEALDHKKFSNKTDTWSFGVTAWEIITYGKEPDLCKSNQLSGVLKKGKRLPQSELCDVKLYDMMLQCWHKDPESRPDFDSLCRLLRS